MAHDLIEDRRGSFETAKIDREWSLFGSRTYYECRVMLFPEETGYSARAIRLPGVVSQGSTPEEALDNIKDAFQAVIQTYLEEDMQIPWTDSAIVERPKGCIERWILVNA
jgi:predicted RNase H-like HicB family nuclease